MAAISPPPPRNTVPRSWAAHETPQACPFSSHARFFECERLCDLDPCCTGFGFLNVSQLKGEGGSNPPTPAPPA